MSDNRLLKIGIVGTVVAAVCCFTPLLAIVAGAVGLTALFGYLDMLHFPALIIFALITIYALWKRQAAY